jgi:hypothetical protein
MHAQFLPLEEAYGMLGSVNKLVVAFFAVCFGCSRGKGPWIPRFLSSLSGFCNLSFVTLCAHRGNGRFAPLSAFATMMRRTPFSHSYDICLYF